MSEQKPNQPSRQPTSTKPAQPQQLPKPKLTPPPPLLINEGFEPGRVYQPEKHRGC